MFLRSTSFLPLVALIGLSACASTENAQDDTDPMDDVRIGEQVNRICFAGSISGFRDWNRSGDGLILRRGQKEEYLVTFVGPCAPADNALSIGVNERFGGGCLGRGDKLFVSNRISPSRGDSPFDSEFCRVGKIYEWNEDAGEEAAESD